MLYAIVNNLLKRVKNISNYLTELKVSLGIYLPPGLFYLGLEKFR